MEFTITNMELTTIGGTIKYFDGIIQGKENAVTDGIVEIEEGYTIKEEKLENFTQITLLEERDNVAQIGDEQYKTLEEAIDSCPQEAEDEETEIVILKDTIILNTIEIEEGKNIKINLNDKKVRFYSPTVGIQNNGTLKIYNINTNEENINIIGYANNLIENNRSLKIIGGTIRNRGKVIQNNGNIDIIDGELIGTGIVIENSEEKVINMSNGKINGGLNNNGAIFNMTGGVIKNSTYNNSYDNSTITNKGNGVINIQGGTITKIIENQEEGTIRIEGGIIDTNLFNGTKTGEIIMTNGTVKYISNSGMAKIEGGVINTIASFGTIIVGKEDGKVDTTNPTINYNSLNSPEISGRFEFYDGTIGAGTRGIMKAPDKIEAGYEITDIEEYSIGSDGNPTTLILYKKQLKEISSMAEVEGNKYTSFTELQEVINNAENNPINITILRDIMPQETDIGLLIPENKNVQIDLNGKNITTIKENMIINNGTLSIIDGKADELINKIAQISEKDHQYSSDIDDIKDTTEIINILNGKSGKIVSSVGLVIENNGEMDLGKVTINSTEGVAVKNRGQLSVNNGTINSSGTAICNENTGEIIIKAGVMLDIEMVNEKRIIDYRGNVGKIQNQGTGKILLSGGVASSIINNNSGEIIIQSVTISYMYIRESEASRGHAVSKSELTKESVENIENNDIGDILVEGEVGSITNNSSAEVVIRGTVGNKSNLKSVITNTSSGTITIENGGIVKKSIDTPTPTIYNKSTGTVKIKGGTVNRGISNASTGTIVVEEGIVNGGISNTTTGTITIGKKDGNVDIANPVIEGVEYGVVNSETGIFNFYDGVIKGNINPVYIAPNSIEENYEIMLDSNNPKSIYLSAADVPLAKIGEIEYNNLSELQLGINNLEESEVKITIEILRNVVIMESENNILIPENKSIEIDLKGHTILASKKETIINNGTLSLTDSNDSVGKILMPLGELIVNNGKMKLDKIKIEKENLEEDKLAPLRVTVIENNNLLEVIGGKSWSGTIINKRDEATVVIKGGTFGEIDNESILGNINMEGGTVWKIYNINSGFVNITGGEITKEIENLKGTINIEGGTIEGRITNGNMLNIKEGNINFIDNMGTLNMEKGTINCTDDNSGYAIYNGNIANITGGAIIGKNGISNRGTLTIGEKGKGVSQTTPVIIGNSYGIYNEGTLNFYDGIIKGKTAYISGTVTEVEPYYEVSLTTDEEGYQCATLTHTSQDDMCAVVNGTYYNTIQAAIDAVIGSEPITLVNGANITEAINIPEGKNITIDLAGFTINSTAENHAIINNGTLRIMDSSEGKTGAIVNQNGPAIQNNGQLTIDEGVTVTPQ